MATSAAARGSRTPGPPIGAPGTGIRPGSLFQFGGDDFARPAVIRRAYHALPLHALDHPGGPVVADLQAPLHVGDRRLAGLGDDAHGVVVHVVVGLLAAALAGAVAALLL